MATIAESKGNSEDTLFSRAAHYDTIMTELRIDIEQFGISWETMPRERQAAWRKRLLGSGFTYEGPEKGWFPPNSVDLSSL
jgi:hypothetical protein